MPTSNTAAPSAHQRRRTPKLRHHKASGRAVVTIEGRDIYLGKHCTDEAQAAYHRVLAEYHATGIVPGPKKTGEALTINELILAYYRDCEKTIKTTIRPALRRIRKYFGPTVAAEFGPRDLRTFQLALVDEDGRSGKKLSRSYINRQVRQVRSLFKWGVGQGLIPASVWHGLLAVDGLKKGRPGLRENEPVRPVSDEDIEATLVELPVVIADMVRVQRLTGMRPAEVCAMRWDEIETNGDIWVYRPERHKNAHRGHERRIPLGPKAQTLLMKHRDRPADAPIFSPIYSERLRRGRAPSRTKHDRYDTMTYGIAIRRACNRAGIDVWSPNQLRHAKATEVRRELGLEGAGAVLGHARLETTQIYAERQSRLADEIAAKTG